jgi:hypothetical protein
MLPVFMYMIHIMNSRVGDFIFPPDREAGNRIAYPVILSGAD